MRLKTIASYINKVALFVFFVSLCILYDKITGCHTKIHSAIHRKFVIIN
ncbi:hypothetical protein HMPREF0080_02121 [Anaeroglobus geminatus F0357]|uniref:Uncharacterized protein n=1 Tax=Anaeroglobus geminatus F0357 TaxID=861450 RepID=G9YKB1_9FIRM|nr:hypothetical protein HMPREF0080_02121 [Anaeroglobus geminatus F0357]